MKISFKFRFILLMFLIISGTVSNLWADPQNVAGVVWYQKSGECKALYYQAYHLADMILKNYLKGKHKAKNPCVVVDIDETIFDNSPEAGGEAKDNAPFSYDRLDEWVKTKKAVATPGAIWFLNRAVKEGFEVFYVTNRIDDERQATLENLRQKFDEGYFPHVDEDHLYTATDRKDTNKEDRRKKIRDKKYKIVLLMGDNLNDLSEAYYGKSNDDRAAQVKFDKDLYGTQYVVLPNPMYGDWDSPTAYGTTNNDYDADRLNALNAWEPTPQPNQ